MVDQEWREHVGFVFAHWDGRTGQFSLTDEKGGPLDVKLTVEQMESLKKAFMALRHMVQTIAKGR
jgi:hypothetical protein